MFESILWHQPGSKGASCPPTEAEVMRDLHLDQVCAHLTAGRPDLEPIFATRLCDPEAIRYRQEIVQDLEEPSVQARLSRFVRRMAAVDEHLAQAQRLHYPYQKRRWWLDAVSLYCQEVEELARDLAGLPLSARGLRALREYVARLQDAADVRALAGEAARCQADLGAISYCLHLQDNRVTVRRYEGEPDYSEEIQRTFARFRQGKVKDYSVTFSSWPDMNHVEAHILDLVARLLPEPFARLDALASRYASFVDPVLARLARELPFYLSYLELIAPLREQGVPFCYPAFVLPAEGIYAKDACDLALALRLTKAKARVVPNDFALEGEERVLVVTGPNQSGKTTFARLFGQLHHLGALGYPVPAAEAQLLLCDRIFTHFPREDNVADQLGGLADDLERVRHILRHASPRSIVLLNELFASTSVADALALGRKVMAELLRLGLVAVWVTFLDELALYGPETVSMVGFASPDDPTARTYRFRRERPRGVSYALALAAKYRLTREQLEERLRP
jgi:DNA mismatch repair protein MutS